MRNVDFVRFNEKVTSFAYEVFSSGDTFAVTALADSVTWNQRKKTDLYSELDEQYTCPSSEIERSDTADRTRVHQCLLRRVGR